MYINFVIFIYILEELGLNYYDYIVIFPWQKLEFYMCNPQESKPDCVIKIVSESLIVHWSYVNMLQLFRIHL